MKKMYLIFAGIVLSASLQISCSSEEAVTQETANAAFLKTPEMVSFETALKDYIISNRSGNPTAKSSSGKIMERESVKLLTSLNVAETDIATSKELSSHELVKLAMKEYSKKLTEMYNQPKN